MANAVLVVMDDESLVTVTPIVRDEEGNITNKGNPTEISLANLAAYIASEAPAGEVSWDDVTDKPAVIAAGTTQALARTAIGAGTSNLAVGAAATDAKAGNYTPPNATTSVKGLVNQAATQANFAGADIAALTVELNAFLAKLKTAGIAS